MKKIIVLSVVIITISLLFTSCKNGNKIIVNSDDKNIKSSYNPFDLDIEANKNSIEFGFGPVDQVNELTYNRIPIEKKYFYSNTGEVNFEAGFMIFIDGIAQNYKIDGEDDEEIMHQFSLEKKTSVQFKVILNPSIAKKNDKLGLYVVNIINPTFMPSPNLPTFGNNHALSQVLPVDLKSIVSIDKPELKIYNKYSTEIVTDIIRKEYLGVSKENKENYVSSGAHLFHLKYNDDHKETKIELNKSAKLSLTLEGLCDSDDVTYRTTIFIDNKPIKTADGYDCLDMLLKKGMLSKQFFDVDIRGITGNHILSTISVPIGKDYSKVTNPVVQSSPKLLIIGE